MKNIHIQQRCFTKTLFGGLRDLEGLLEIYRLYRGSQDGKHDILTSVKYFHFTCNIALARRCLGSREELKTLLNTHNLPRKRMCWLGGVLGLIGERFVVEIIRSLIVGSFVMPVETFSSVKENS